jgi:anthranilate phosphoribosyltransferase
MSPLADLPPQEEIVLITPLLRRLWPSPAQENVTADEIAAAISHIFTNSLSPVQSGALLTALHFTGWDRRADVLKKCAQAMRSAASPIDVKALKKVIRKRGRKEGNYHGGLVWQHLSNFVPAVHSHMLTGSSTTLV